jgi:hypothetical protein
MKRHEPETQSPPRKPYVRPELKEFGTIAALTENNSIGTKPDGATMGNDKSLA